MMIVVFELQRTRCQQDCVKVVLVRLRVTTTWWCKKRWLWVRTSSKQKDKIQYMC